MTTAERKLNEICLPMFALCRSRLAGEEAREPCPGHWNAFAGKPAPTGRGDQPRFCSVRRCTARRR
ncbi:hypothetical protein FW796_21020 [Pseudomonas sp. 910_21]